MVQPGRKDGPSRTRGDKAWKLEDAKARFSEVVRLAQSQGPQSVTVRGREAVVIMSAEEFKRMGRRGQPKTALLPFLEGLHLHDLTIDREEDRGRDIEL